MTRLRAVRRRNRPAPNPSPGRLSRWLALGVGAIAALAVVAIVAIGTGRPSGGAAAGQKAWARLDTSDVHSLAFPDNDTSRVLFGHHGGISQSRDGGRSWQPLPIREDAMGMAPAADGSIVIAGHLVFTASRDGGQTWQPIAANLPNLDIHGFARDPGDPARLWAALATGGLWESSDFGTDWTRVRDDNVLMPVAVRADGTTKLLALDVSGLVVSDDGGRTWNPLATPPTYPMTALTATADGKVIYAGASDGLYRSDDSGTSWTATAYKGSAFAIATSDDGATVAVVSRETDFFRSPDGGKTWPGPG